MAARLNAVRKRALDDAEIFIHRLRAGQIHLFEDMIIRTAHEDTRFGDARVLDQFKILFVRADPCRDFGECEPQILTLFERAAVLFAIQEKFALADNAFRPAEARHQLKDIDDLFDRERRCGLLAVAEGRIRDPNFRRHIHRHVPIIENDLGDLVVRVQVAEQFRFLYVLQLIVIFIFFQ